MTKLVDRPTRGEARRSELIGAGIALLAEAGWAGVTHRKLATRAGANPGLVHYYFKGTAGLHRAIAEAIMSELISPVVDRLHAASSLAEFAEVLAESLRTTAADEQATKVLMPLLAGAMHDAAVADVVLAETRKARLHLANWVAQRAPAFGDAKSNAVGALLAAAIDGVFLHLALDPELDPAQLAKALTELADLAAASARPGEARPGEAL